MHFNVCFIYQIDTVLITQLCPEWIIGIMAGTDSIDIVLLHQTDVLEHGCLVDSMAPDLIMLVTVDTMHVECSTVDEQLSIFDLYFAETNFGTCNAKGIGFVVL